MAKNQIAIRMGVRQNKNTKSPSYNKWYPEVINAETLSTRGLLEHIMSHGLGYPRAIVQGVLAQIAECLTELILQGQPVKLDGLGTFKLECKSKEGGITTLTSGMDIRQHIEGLRLVVIPDNTELDKLTSVANLDRAALTLDGVLQREDIGQTSGGKAKSATKLTALDVYLYEQAHPNP